MTQSINTEKGKAVMRVLSGHYLGVPPFSLFSSADSFTSSFAQLHESETIWNNFKENHQLQRQVGFGALVVCVQLWKVG